MVPRVPDENDLLTRHTQIVASILNGLIRQGNIEQMTDGEWRLAVEKKFRDGPQAFATSSGTLYTAPSTGVTLKQIYVYNRNAGSQTFSLSVGADATTTRIADTESIATKTRLIINVDIPLAPSETIQGISSSTDVNVLFVGVITQSNAAATIT